MWHGAIPFGTKPRRWKRACSGSHGEKLTPLKRDLHFYEIKSAAVYSANGVDLLLPIPVSPSPDHVPLPRTTSWPRVEIHFDDSTPRLAGRDEAS